MRRILFASVLCTAPAIAYASPVDDANAGADALSAGHYSKAVELFTKALHSGKLSSADAESAYVERGKAYLGENANKLAAADFARALKLNPDDQEAVALAAQAQNSHAATASSSSPVLNAAKALWQKGDYTGAEGAFQKILLVDPYNAAANYYYADCLVRRGDVPDAVLPLRLAVQYGGDGSEAQLARDAAKSLGAQLSPNQGVAMGCAVPVAPPIGDGATATDQQMSVTRDHIAAYVQASDSFQKCLIDEFGALQQQAAQSGGTFAGTALERKYQSQIDRNQQERQATGDQFNAAFAAYTAAHRH